MNCAIAMFVKSPELSPVKTRLWPAIGRAQAENLHRASAAAVRSVVEQATARGQVHGYWALAESAEASARLWPGLLHVEQGEGSLGERMAAVYRQLRQHHAGVILIGADAPQLESSTLLQATDWLDAGEARLAIGRAVDGGFWLFGGNRDITAHAWIESHYSQPDTATEFVRAMDTFGKWLELGNLQDMDTVADIAAVRAKLDSLPEATVEQQTLCELLGELSTIAVPCP